MQSNVKLWNRFEFLHISSPPATKASYFLHYLLIDQLYAKELYFCIFVTKSSQASTKYSADVFNSFYRTITHGEFHVIFTSSPSNGVSPSFTTEPPFCCLPTFSLKSFKPPPHDTQYFNRSWQASSHIFFHFKQNFLLELHFFHPHWNTSSKVYAVSKDPDVPPLTELEL